MLRKVSSQIDKAIFSLLAFNIFTSYLGLARSVLALGTLLTLLFNKTSVLFSPTGKSAEVLNFIIVRRFGFFNLLPSSRLDLSVWIAIIILIVVISGWRPQITCFLHAYISVSFINSAITIEGGDQITSNLTLLLIPICICDPRKNHWFTLNEIQKKSLLNIGERVLIANFFYLITRLQVALLYFHSAVGKFPSKEWQNGTAVYYWFNNPIFGMPDYLRPVFEPLITNSYPVVLITWGVLIFEIVLFLGLVLQPKYRKYILAAGIVFHFFILLIHGLFSFFIAMAGALILFLGDLKKDLSRS